jgi:hypothetical protein
MVLPGIAGAWLDSKLETNWLSPLGFGVGLIVGTVGLVVLAKRFTPPARGTALPFDETKNSKESDEASGP